MTTARARPRLVEALPNRRITAAPALGAIGLGSAAVLALWWNDTVYISGVADWLTNAGRLTGLECGYGVVVLLALMARVPALEHGVGTDRLARWHAIGGRYIVSLAVAHTMFIIWGYSLTAHRSLIGETADLNTQYPDVLMATAAVAVLVAVGIASARAARARLAYETWHFIHLYTYLAVALAFSHQFATGADFTDRRVRVLWSVMYIAVGSTLLRYRVLAPILSAVRHDFRVSRVQRESRDTFSLYVTGADVGRLRAQPGQFFRWRFLTRELWWVAGPYSLSAPASDDTLRITVRIAGAHSAALADVKPGTRVLAEGPYGGLTASRRRRRDVLLIAGGVGITPLRTLFETLPGGPGSVTLLYRATHALDVVLRHELDDIAARRGASVHYAIGPRTGPGGDPLSAHNLRRRLGDIRRFDVYLCGPQGMTSTARAALRQLMVPASRIHEESFTF